MPRPPRASGLTRFSHPRYKKQFNRFHAGPSHPQRVRCPGVRLIMICKRCKSATAIISLPSHNTGFCEDCFRDFFTAQVARGIETGKLFTHEDRILVALSGGKDSLSLMLELSRQGYDVTGLHIDLGIPGTSGIVRGVIERFCDKHGFRLIVKEMEKEGLAIPLVKQRLKRPVCSACGKIKRRIYWHYRNC